VPACAADASNKKIIGNTPLRTYRAKLKIDVE